MKLRTLFRLFLLLAAVAPITTAKADSLIIGTDTLRLDLHWLDDTPLDELARDDRAFEKKFQALIHQPTVEGFVIYIDGDHEHHSYSWSDMKMRPDVQSSLSGNTPDATHPS